MGDVREAFNIERITVGRGRLCLIVRVAPGVRHTTDKVLSDRLLNLRPSLAQHTCVNGRGSTFASVIAQTSLPHVLEHVIIDEQVRATEEPTDITFVGTTEWLDEHAGRARIEVNFTDDLIALCALHNAIGFLNREVLR